MCAGYSELFIRYLEESLISGSYFMIRIAAGLPSADV